MDPLNVISDGRIVSLSDGSLTAADIMLLHSNPRRTCDCCGGEAYHEMGFRLGPLVISRHFKCGSCDEDGMVYYHALS